MYFEKEKRSKSFVFCCAREHLQNLVGEGGTDEKMGGVWKFCGVKSKRGVSEKFNSYQGGYLQKEENATQN